VTRLRALCAAFAILGLLLASCGGSEGVIVPTQQDLAASLLTVEDLGGDWLAVPDFASGILSDEMKNEFTLPELCVLADTAAMETAAGLEWQVGAAFSRGEVPERDYVPTLVQLMLAGEPAQIASTFTTLRNGFAACAGTDQVFEGEGSFRIEAVTLPDVGDDRIGLRYQQTDAPADHVHFDMRLMLVRDGAVIMWLNETEITLAAEPSVTVDELGDILAAAVENLP
jgi:hypothetical protein